MTIEPNARHLELALAVHAYESWTTGRYWTDGAVLLVCAEPFPAGASLALGCDGQKLCFRMASCEHRWELWGRPIQKLRKARKVYDGVLKDARQVGLAMKPDGRKITYCGIDTRRFQAITDRRWLYVDDRYVQLIRRQYQPDNWRFIEPRTMLVADRAGATVAVVMPLHAPGSLASWELLSERRAALAAQSAS